MRVISGKAGGRILKAVPGMGTRPTTDKVKEAVFSMIGPYFEGGVAIDLFAGTGGLGIEALSRGMDRAIFTDCERKSVEIVRENLRITGLEQQAEVYRNDAFRALKALAKRNVQADLIFLDPPYRLEIIEELLLKIGEYRLAREGAVAVAEQDASRLLPERIGSFERLRRSDYGETAIHLYAFRETKQEETGRDHP